MLNATATNINGVYVIASEAYSDNRGSFKRLYCANELSDIIEERNIVQINHSHTRVAGAIRGLHFQYPPYAEMKLIRCIRGRVFDVAVDLRKNSPTFLHWHAEELSEDNSKMLVIPEGCAHGFQTLVDDCEMLYLHTEFYHPENEGGVKFDDPALKIEWPAPNTDLSARDEKHPMITPDFSGIEL